MIFRCSRKIRLFFHLFSFIHFLCFSTSYFTSFIAFSCAERTGPMGTAKSQHAATAATAVTIGILYRTVRPSTKAQCHSDFDPKDQIASDCVSTMTDSTVLDPQKVAKVSIVSHVERYPLVIARPTPSLPTHLAHDYCAQLAAAMVAGEYAYERNRLRCGYPHTAEEYDRVKSASAVMAQVYASCIKQQQEKQS
jgi:hypothetical protein